MNRTLSACCCIVVASCAASPFEDDWPQGSTPLGRDLESPRLPADPGPPPPPLPQVVEPAGALTLADAMGLTVRHSPLLASFAWEVRARDAATIQAGLWPNPELGVEVENFGGTGPASGFDGSETTFTVGQTLLLGDKLARRVAVARLERDLAGWDYEAARAEALTRVAGAFIDTVAAQERLALARDAEALAARIHASVGERVEAGKVSPVERTRARIDHAQALLARRSAERRLAAARHRLSANWGSVSSPFERAAGDLAAVEEPPGTETLLERVEHNPDLARWVTETALRREALRLAEAEAVPDVTVFAGPRLLDGADDTAFVAGVSLPLPLFDRNQGGILEARVRGARASELRRSAEVRVRADLAAAAEMLQAAYVEAVAIRDEIEPDARLALEAAEEAFRQGKAGVLELLDSQRTLFSVRRRQIDALAAYHLAVIAVERLIGEPLTPQGVDSP